MAEQKQMQTHTPGPWKVVEYEDKWHPRIESDLDPHCAVGEAFAANVCCEANARLMAAAPDMLAALRDALELAKLAESLTGCRGDDDYVWGLQEKFAAAIAKAEGRATGAEG